MNIALYPQKEDIVSRGCDAEELIASFWFDSAFILKEPKESWLANQHLTRDETRSLRECKKADGLAALVI